MKQQERIARNSGDLDPRSVLFLLISVAVWISTTETTAGALSWAIGAMLAVVYYRREIAARVPALRSLLIGGVLLALLTFVLYILFVPADGSGTWSLPLGEGDRDKGLRMGLRFLGYLGLGLSVTVLATPTGLASGLTRIAHPLGRFGVPVQNIYYLSLFVFRLVPSLLAEARIIRMAQASRGIRFDGGPVRRLRSGLAIVIPVFAAAGRRADRLSMALWARGADLERVPLAVTTLRWRPRDWTVATLVCLGWALYLLPVFGIHLRYPVAF